MINVTIFNNATYSARIFKSVFEGCYVWSKPSCCLVAAGYSLSCFLVGNYIDIKSSIANRAVQYKHIISPTNIAGACLFVGALLLASVFFVVSNVFYAALSVLCAFDKIVSTLCSIHKICVVDSKDRYKHILFSFIKLVLTVIYIASIYCANVHVPSVFIVALVIDVLCSHLFKQNIILMSDQFPVVGKVVTEDDASPRDSYQQSMDGDLKDGTLQEEVPAIDSNDIFYDTVSEPQNMETSVVTNNFKSRLFSCRGSLVNYIASLKGYCRDCGIFYNELEIACRSLQDILTETQEIYGIDFMSLISTGVVSLMFGSVAQNLEKIRLRLKDPVCAEESTNILNDLQICATELETFMIDPRQELNADVVKAIEEQVQALIERASPFIGTLISDIGRMEEMKLFCMDFENSLVDARGDMFSGSSSEV